MTVKGKFNKKAIRAELKQLEKQLEETKASNLSSWNNYGGDLCAGSMIEEEKKIEREITKLKNKLAPNETYNELLATSLEHKNELILNCGPTVALLLPGIEDDGEDYYWRLFDLHQGFHYSSCVGRIDYLKGKIDDAYKFLIDIFKLNYKRVIALNEKNNAIMKEIEDIFNA